MSLTLELPSEVEAELTDFARASGRTPEAVVTDLLERRFALGQIDEILAPFRKQVAESGITEDELNAFFEEVREEVWQEQQGKAK